MKRLQLAILAIAGITGIIGLIKIAEASYRDPYKVIINGKTSIYIPGQTPGQPANNLTSLSSPKPRILTLNNCGIARISKGTTSPIIDITGNGINFSGRTTGGKPTCTLDRATSTYSSSWNAPVGSVLDDGTAFYIKGGTSAGAINVNVTNDSKINTKANACGTIRINTSDSRPLTTFNLNGTEYSLDSLPDKLPELCRSSTKYLPINEAESSGG